MEGGEEVEESKWQDRIAFRFDQIVSFAHTAMEDKRRRSTDEGNCNTSPDSGIGHGGEAAGGPRPVAPHSPAPRSPPIEPPLELSLPPRTPSPAATPEPAPETTCSDVPPGAPCPSHHFKKKFFHRERYGPWRPPEPETRQRAPPKGRPERRLEPRDGKDCKEWKEWKGARCRPDWERRPPM